MNIPAAGLTAEAVSNSPHVGVDDSALSAERPFPGLRPFFFDDREFFFGRERQTFALYRLVEHGRFIAVVGSSGSGKSSLVLAGLRQLLEEESADPGGPNWVCLDMRPGASPISKLAKALARLMANERPDEAARRRDRIEWRLRQSSFSFENALEEAGGLAGRTLLLVIDQFEELFRFGLAGLGSRRAAAEQASARDEATQFVQILLDADRRRLKDVRVLITMRSDFIGDCAYFHGLSEAVSATQYLVPNLTRGQLEEVITKPIEKAGGTIEPELVERLLNDCGDELDQLPVLQHCLMRLWDRAGVACAAGPRRLTRRTYDDIGRMTDALSRHADEILAQCAGKELAVEQAFRALSELDREGRAIRRALRFDKLLAETGVPEADLRAVLDRFRASNCSFLLPSLSSSPRLAAEDRVDIGHEALLRRWKAIAGTSQTVEAKTDRAAPGWIDEEQIDGQRYRTLVSLLDGDPGEQVTLNDPERTKAWWDSMRRTAAWADRYGGRFEAVNKLIDDSIAAKRREKEAQERAKRTQRLVYVVAPATMIAIGALYWISNSYQQAIQERLRQEEIDKSAMSSAKTLLERILDARNEQSLDLVGAKSLVTVSQQFLDDVHNSNKTSAADPLWAQSLSVQSDLYAASENYEAARKSAETAIGVAQTLAASNPSGSEPLRILYDATIRVGNALTGLGAKRLPDALDAYNGAVGIATKITSVADSETAEDDLIDAHVKIGDVHKGRGQHSEALANYRISLSISETALQKFPGRVTLLRDRGEAFDRIAQSLAAQGSYDEAREAYQKALDIRSALVRNNPNPSSPEDPSLRSELAATFTHRAELEQKAGRLDLALDMFMKGVGLDQQLVKTEPGNLQWEGYLARGYSAVAEISDSLGRPVDALAYYQKLLDTRRILAYRLGPPKARKELAEAAKMLGDRSQGFAQNEAYRLATRVWQRIVEDPDGKMLAIDQFDVVLDFARRFKDQSDWPNAKIAYDTAKEIATLNLANDPSNTSWRKSFDEAGVEAVKAEAALQSVRP